MSKYLLANRRVYAVQNGLAACLFLLLLAAEALAYLLHSFPSSEILWKLTIPANRIAGPFLGAADHAIQTPFILLAVLAFAAIIPAIAYWRRSWLATAICGHVALGLSIVLTFDAIKRSQTGRMTASLSAAFDSSILDSSVMSLIAVSLVMAGLCLINHIVFFADVKG